MNAVSPASKTGLPVKLALTADDTRIDTDQIASVEIWWEANRVPRARIVIYDGQPDSETFPFSDAETFVPGAKIVLSAGYGSDLAVIHKGVVVRHGLRIVPGASAQLVVDTSDPLLKMTLARHSAVTEKATDAALISALVSANGGSVRGNAAATTPVEAMVQAHATDWDLMLLRAEASGCVVVIDDSEVAVIAPTASTSPVLTLEYGEFDPELRRADRFRVPARRQRREQPRMELFGPGRDRGHARGQHRGDGSRQSEDRGARRRAGRFRLCPADRRRARRGRTRQMVGRRTHAREALAIHRHREVPGKRVGQAGRARHAGGARRALQRRCVRQRRPPPDPRRRLAHDGRSRHARRTLRQPRREDRRSARRRSRTAAAGAACRPGQGQSPKTPMAISACR